MVNKTMKKRDIVVYSVPRSGATLIVNLIGDIIGRDNVQDSHAYAIYHDSVVICLRDFRDCIASYYNAHYPLRGSIDIVDYLKLIIMLKRNLKTLNKYRDEEVLFLRYERFVNDFDYIFDKLESYFNIKIDNNQREKLKKEYSIKEMRKIAKKCKNKKHEKYGLVDTSVGNGKSKWFETIPKKYHLLTYYLLRKDLLLYGYHKDKLILFKDDINI